MATQWQTFPIEFKGGLISNMSALQQGTNAIGSATILQNMEPSKEGGYSKILGFQKYSSTTVPGSGAMLGLKVISAGKIIAARKNANNFTEYYYSTGSSWTSMGASSATNGGKARFADFNLDGNDKVVFVDGTNFPAIYNDTNSTVTFLTSSNSSDIQGAEHVAIFKNAAFYSKENNLYFTAPFTVDDFATGNGAGVINIGNPITGLAVFRDQLIIFTTDTIKKLTGNTSSDFAVSPITNKIGCVNGDTIQEVGGDIMYLAPDGIRLLSATDRIGDFALDIASDVIFEDANKFLSSTTNFTSLLLREKAQYRIFAFIGSEQEAAAKGLIATKFISQGATGISWSTTKGIKAHVADSTYVNSVETSAFANEDGYIYILNTGSNFDGASIEAIYESPFMPLTDPQMRKTFYKLTLYATPSGNMTLTGNLKFDFSQSGDTSVAQPSTFTISSTGSSVFLFGASSSIFNSSTFGGELDIKYGKNLIGSAKTVALRFEDFSTNPTYTLDTALLEFTQNDRQ